MSYKKQSTLFQSWKTNQLKEKATEQKQDEDDDLADIELLKHVEEYEKLTQSQNVVYKEDKTSGFDRSKGDLWIYPTNYSVRSYQLNIVRSALFNNTLVSLPTGLGKTFIAAVVMYNFYRWYPKGKVIFLAPTKPLVTQQITACYDIMGIPIEDQAEITGSTMQSGKREELWNAKRVFFLTPQCFNNDLTKGVCPVECIKCVVFDEAHKATGNYAYCQVVQQLQAYGCEFRVLALSATPGSNLESTNQVIRNLLISKVEFRCENSLDIQPYTHSRKINKIVVKLDSQILEIQTKFFQVIQRFIDNLVKNKAIYRNHASQNTKYSILMAREDFRKNPPVAASRSVISSIEGDFAICLSLYHCLELLTLHGIKSFYIFLKGMLEGPKAKPRVKHLLQTNQTFNEIILYLAGIYGENPNSVVSFTQTPYTKAKEVTRIYSHPKLKEMERIVVNHFKTFKPTSDQMETRVMVFSQYRESVFEITELLQTFKPLIKPMQFVGHQGSNLSNDGNNSVKRRRFTQNDQLKVIEEFRKGNFNTLVSTCVGEEGLDIGEVDLIVCFDSHKSPIRLVQRIGRTGRKRDGKVVMLVTEGKENKDYDSSVARRSSISKAMDATKGRLNLYTSNPRMVPSDLNPNCHKTLMSVPDLPKSSDKSSCIPSAFKKKETKKSKKDIYLTNTQQIKWKSSLYLTQRSETLVKSLSLIPPTIYCLQKEKQWKPTSLNREFQLDKWPSEQRMLQKTSLISHSLKSIQFTEIMKFCGDVIDEEDRDEYLMQKIPLLKKSCGKMSIEEMMKEKRRKRRRNHQVIVISSDEDDLMSKDQKKNPKKIRIKGDEDLKDQESKDEDLKDQKLEDEDLKDQKLKDEDFKDRESKDKDLKDQKLKDEDLKDKESKDEDLKDKESKDEDLKDDFSTTTKVKDEKSKITPKKLETSEDLVGFCIADQLTSLFPPLDSSPKKVTKDLKVPTPPKSSDAAQFVFDLQEEMIRDQEDDHSSQKILKMISTPEDAEENLDTSLDLFASDLGIDLDLGFELEEVFKKEEEAEEINSKDVEKVSMIPEEQKTSKDFPKSSDFQRKTKQILFSDSISSKLPIAAVAPQQRSVPKVCPDSELEDFVSPFKKSSKSNDSDTDDFSFTSPILKRRKKALKVVETPSPLTKTQYESTPKKKIESNPQKKVNRKLITENLVDDEAEVSGEQSSDEEEDEDIDEDLIRFVNDSSEINPTDRERAMYLKSVQDPATSHGRYKLAYGVGEELNVFSQKPPSQEDYQQNSFCVGDEDISFEDDKAPVTTLSAIDEDDVMVIKQRSSNQKKMIAFEDSDGGSPIKHKAAPTSIQSSSCKDRFCEVCEILLTNTKGWLCASCLSLIKSTDSSSTNQRASLDRKSLNVSRASSTDLNFSERLERSLQKQKMIRARRKKKCDQDSASPAFLTHKPVVECERTSLDSCKTGLNFDLEEDAISESQQLLLVDSRAISSSNILIQKLRTQHKIKVIIVSLGCCGFVVGQRCAVIRRSVSDLNGISNRRRLVEQLQKTQLKYEEVFLIVEQNPISSDNNKIKDLKSNLKQNNYESFLIEITSNKTQVLQSENQEETAAFLSTILQHQKTQKLQIKSELAEIASLSTSGSGAKGREVKYLTNIFLCISHLSYVDVLMLCWKFRSLEDVILCSIEQLQMKCNLNFNKASLIHQFFRHKFNLQMISL